MGIQENIVEEFEDEELLFADGFDHAILGVDNNGRVVYDIDVMLDILCNGEGMTNDQALEYLEFNTFGAYVGERTPIYVRLSSRLLT